MHLWLCLRLSQLPLEALCRDDRQPVIIVAKQRVVTCNDLAAEQGVSSGQTSRTAQQLLADMQGQWLERDPDAEAAALEQLLGWAYGFSPTVQSWKNDCLLLEIGGCLRLFSGLHSLLQRALGELSRRGYHAQPGVATTRHAAWLLSHASGDHATDPSPPLASRLASMPLSLLDDFSSDVTALERAGIRTFDDLLALPTRSLGRRCSQDFRRWLAQLTGTQREVTTDHAPPRRFRDALWFGFEVRHQEELLPAMTELLRKLSEFLRHTQLEARCLQWQLLRLQGTADPFEVRSDSAGGDWRRWLELSSLRLERLTIGRDIEGIALVVESLSPLQTHSHDLFADARQREPQQALVDRLRSRLGLAAIRRVGSRREHLPEHCIYSGSEAIDPPTDMAGTAQRPFWLLPQPQPISERDGTLFWNGPLSLRYGPERIEDGWWQAPVSRDYFIAEGDACSPLWIFQDRRSKRWYLHGLFD